MPLSPGISAVLQQHEDSNQVAGPNGVVVEGKAGIDVRTKFPSFSATSSKPQDWRSSLLIDKAAIAWIHERSGS